MNETQTKFLLSTVLISILLSLILALIKVDSPSFVELITMFLVIYIFLDMFEDA